MATYKFISKVFILFCVVRSPVLGNLARLSQYLHALSLRHTHTLMKHSNFRVTNAEWTSQKEEVDVLVRIQGHAKWRLIISRNRIIRSNALVGVFFAGMFYKYVKDKTAIRSYELRQLFLWRFFVARLSLKIHFLDSEDLQVLWAKTRICPIYCKQVAYDMLIWNMEEQGKFISWIMHV